MYVRRLDAAWEVFAPAKLNFYLDVLGRRPDGFHELETLMVPVRLYDRLRLRLPRPDEPSGFSLSYDQATPPEVQAAAPADRRNLAYRAAELLARAAGIEPVGRMTLDKRIPAGAGLGGGSSDAAAALLAANAAWGLNYPIDRLAPLAAELGSDVPFFLAGQSAVCRGRGERVEPIVGLPRLNAVIVMPPGAVSTSRAFGALAASRRGAPSGQESRNRVEALLAALQRGSLAEAARWMTNRLQDVAAEMSPWIHRLQDAFTRLGCLGHQMTGSGSAYFGMMPSARCARRAAAMLSSQNLGAVVACATVR